MVVGRAVDTVWGTTAAQVPGCSSRSTDGSGQIGWWGPMPSGAEPARAEVRFSVHNGGGNALGRRLPRRRLPGSSSTFDRLFRRSWLGTRTTSLNEVRRSIPWLGLGEGSKQDCLHSQPQFRCPLSIVRLEEKLVREKCLSEVIQWQSHYNSSSGARQPLLFAKNIRNLYSPRRFCVQSPQFRGLAHPLDPIPWPAPGCRQLPASQRQDHQSAMTGTIMGRRLVFSYR